MALAVACASLGVAPERVRAETVTEIKVERVRPKRAKNPTLRFLKANRDFIRSQIDLLRERPLDRHEVADAIDPRFLEYQKMMSEILAAKDSTESAEDARRAKDLFESVTDLGRLEAQLDQMDRLLAEQRERLEMLQRDFTGRQRTAIAILMTGYPEAGEVVSVGIKLDDGDSLRVPLTSEQRESLKHGGILEAFHGLIEPREQVLAITLGGYDWPAGASGFLTLEPPRDRLTFLRLDLRGATPAEGAATMKASTWLHDPALEANKGSESEP